MPLVPVPNEIQWLTGDQVEAAKALIRETDTTYLMQVLFRAFGQNGPLFQAAENIQTICNQATTLVAGQQVQNPIQVNGQSIWSGYDNDPAVHNDFTINIRLMATLRILRGNTLLNPLAIGDFCRAFADMITAAPNIPNTAAGLAPISQLISSLQNPQAFNKTTNRIRIKRRDILDQVPGVGITQWYLPSDDVLGTVDRFLAYYETGDISGTTTDSLAILAVVSTIAGADIAAIDDIKAQIATMVNDGLAFASFAGMVVQMHHSLPECMMAINLMPRDLGAPNSAITQVYSPLLSNANLGDIAGVYAEWQQARYTALGGLGPPPPNGMRMILVLQDIFQMPNRASASNEVAVILPFTYQDMTNNAYVFGSNFYNRIVATLNTPNPGPAITLEKLSSEIFDMWFGPAFDPAIANPPFGPPVTGCVQRGMALPDGVLDNANQYRQLVAPFVDQAAYGQVEPAVVGNLA